MAAVCPAGPDPMMIDLVHRHASLTFPADFNANARLGAIAYPALCGQAQHLPKRRGHAGYATPDVEPEERLRDKGRWRWSKFGVMRSMQVCMGVVDLPENTIQPTATDVRFLRMNLLEHEPGCDTKLGSAGSQQRKGGVVVPSEFLQIAEGLNHLDPVRTYPSRAAKLVAGLANATSFRVELEQETSESSTVRRHLLCTDALCRFRLRHGRQVLGTIHLFLPEGTEKLEGQDLRLARWGARALARGLSYSSRMNRPASKAGAGASRCSRASTARR